MTGPRVLVAENAGPFTLGGTRTFLIGSDRVAVVDPGPDEAEHLEEVAAAVAGAREGTILLTHGHPDHAGGAGALAHLTGFPVAGNVEGVEMELRGGDHLDVDEGRLEVVDTPGHARRHLSFFHVPSRDLFVGDLLLGEGDTTWVGEYPGCVADYLASLDRIEALRPARIHPAHGPVLDDPAAAVSRFREHRLARVRQVEDVLERMGVHAATLPDPPDAFIEEVVDRVYGSDLHRGLRLAARWSVRALLEYLKVLPFPSEGAPTEEGNRLAGGS